MSSIRKPRRDPELRGMLEALFPAAFPPADAEPVPLKRGIHKELRGATSRLPPMPRRSERVHRFLYGWTQRAAYLAAMTGGRPRVGLDGEVVGEVTEAEAATAKGMLEQRARNLAAVRAGLGQAA